jgi:hypothetical protein
LAHNNIQGDPANLLVNTNLKYLYLYDNSFSGTVPDMRHASNLKSCLCGEENIIEPSNDPAVNSFAEKIDQTRWSAADGCN